MGQSTSNALGAKSTALEVYQNFVIEEGNNFLKGKTVIVTGNLMVKVGKYPKYSK